MNKLKALNAEIKEVLDRIKTMKGGQAVDILRSVPGIGPSVLAAIQCDSTSRAKYRALRSRGHKHVRALRSVADRLLTVVCKMIETGQTFDPERRSKGAP